MSRILRRDTSPPGAIMLSNSEKHNNLSLPYSVPFLQIHCSTFVRKQSHDFIFAARPTLLLLSQWACLCKTSLYRSRSIHILDMTPVLLASRHIRRDDPALCGQFLRGPRQGSRYKKGTPRVYPARDAIRSWSS